MPRLFIAVWPPASVVDAIAARPIEHRDGLRLIPAANWHITLRFVGDADPERVIAALDGAALPAARARVGGSIAVIGDRVLAVPMEGLDELAASVIDLTSAIGEPPGDRFVGHLTIARSKRRLPRSAAVGTIDSVAFDVDAVALVRSRLDSRGAKYDTLASWPLT